MREVFVVLLLVGLVGFVAGEASVEVINNIHFGSGAVTGDVAVLNSNGTVTGGTWNFSSGGIVINNSGDVSVALDINVSDTAVNIIGGSSPSIKFRMTDTDGGCSGAALSDYTSIGITPTRLCSSLTAGSSVELDVELTIPDDAPFTVGDYETFTVTATVTALS